MKFNLLVHFCCRHSSSLLYGSLGSLVLLSDHTIIRGEHPHDALNLTRHSLDLADKLDQWLRRQQCDHHGELQRALTSGQVEWLAQDTARLDKPVKKTKGCP